MFNSFAGTGLVAVVVAWFILPEVARRTPGEIDEMSVTSCIFLMHNKANHNASDRFEKKVNLRHFKGYVTEVQMRADEEYPEKEQNTPA